MKGRGVKRERLDNQAIDRVVNAQLRGYIEGVKGYGG